MARLLVALSLLLAAASACAPSSGSVYRMVRDIEASNDLAGVNPEAFIADVARRHCLTPVEILIGLSLRKTKLPGPVADALREAVADDDGKIVWSALFPALRHAGDDASLAFFRAYFPGDALVYDRACENCLREVERTRFGSYICPEGGACRYAKY